jgi:hypothetical protein
MCLGCLGGVIVGGGRLVGAFMGGSTGGGFYGVLVAQMAGYADRTNRAWNHPTTQAR